MPVFSTHQNAALNAVSDWLKDKPGVKLHSKEQNTILLELEADGKIVIRRRSDGAWFVRLAS